MLELSARKLVNAATPVVEPPAPAMAGPGQPPALSSAALEVACEPLARAYSSVVIAGVVRAIDAALITALSLAIHFVYVYPNDGFESYYIVAIVSIATLSGVLFQAFELYNLHALRTPLRQIGRIGAAWTLAFLLALAIAFFAKLEGMFSRVWLASTFGFGFAALFGCRLIVSRLVRNWTREGRLDRRTAIVGGGEAGEKLIEAINSLTDSGVRILGVFDDRGDDRSPTTLAGRPKLGTVDDLVEFARRTRLDLVIFSLPISAEVRILQMLKKLWVLPVDIRLAAHSNKLRFRPRAYSFIGNVPVLDIFDKPITDWDVVLKWLFDKIVGSALLLLTAPVMTLIAIAIKLDSRGPVFFKQKRYGFNNELIEVFKFRSMYADQADPTASKLATRNDPRITRVGRFIRKASLDELPQLVNVVFKGNLSLVGPRPHAIHAKAQNRLYDEAVDGYFARHKVKPGITGWAQVNGWRGETDTHEKIQRRVEHDLYYIENWSVLFDAYILAITPFALAKTENAY
jgi:Undecaprenyl-phosphate glucose phosphotransferase